MKIKEIKQRITTNRNASRQGRNPDIIVCHITEGDFPGSINWVCNPESKVSYHYMISREGDITQCVPIHDTAWANGTTTNGDSQDAQHSLLSNVRKRRDNANLYTVSIGFEGRHALVLGALTGDQIQAAVSLCNHIRNEIIRLYGYEIMFDRENVVGHSDISPKHKPNCPGQRFPFNEILYHLNLKEEVVMRYNTLNEIPAGILRNSVLKWIRDGHIQGTGTNANGEVIGLNLTEDMIRSVIIAERIINARP